MSARRTPREPELDLLEPLDLIAKLRRFFELEVSRLFIHLGLELLDLPHDTLRFQVCGRRSASTLAAMAAFLAARGAARPRPFHDVRHGLLDAARSDAVSTVVLE